MRGPAPPNVNLGPHYISETIRARKLKFYTHLGRIKCSFWGMKILLQGGVSGVQRPIMYIRDPLISRKILELYKFEILRTFTHGQVHFSGVNFFPPGVV